MTCSAVIGAGTIGTVHARNVAAHPEFTLDCVIEREGQCVGVERVR